ncbi:hypothetical protein M3221_22805 [Domibacillus indicus]|uniref:hypothetical protein n=1 Tax=Domibacillus indicus TaxID=1437523 RepID=UPI00204237EB|nr:hypothetical protein [Domibacillus indicus]MCM3791169.1 hypothetical protein [Domibacillus indicus]
MYKKMIAFTITASLLVGCQNSEQNAQQDSSNSALWETLTELDQADSIEIVDGRNGKRISVTDEKEIEEVKRFIEGIEIKKKDFEEVMGTSHHINIKNKGEVTDALFFLGKRLSINGEKYEIQNEFDPAFLDKLLETHEHIEHIPE